MKTRKPGTSGIGLPKAERSVRGRDSGISRAGWYYCDDHLYGCVALDGQLYYVRGGDEAERYLERELQEVDR